MSFLSFLCKEVATFKVRNLSDIYYIISLCSATTKPILTFFRLVTGYAQMTSPIGKDKSPEFGSSSLSGVFNVEWIKKYVDIP